MPGMVNTRGMSGNAPLVDHKLDLHCTAVKNSIGHVKQSLQMSYEGGKLIGDQRLVLIEIELVNDGSAARVIFILFQDSFACKSIKLFRLITLRH